MPGFGAQTHGQEYEYTLAQGYFEYFKLNLNGSYALIYGVKANSSVTVDIMNADQFMCFNTTGVQREIYQQNSSQVVNGLLVTPGTYYLVVYSPFYPSAFNVYLNWTSLQFVKSTEVAQEEVTIPSQEYFFTRLHLTTMGSPFTLNLEGLSNESVSYVIWNSSTVFNSSDVTITLGQNYSFGYNIHLSPGVYYLNITNPHSESALAYFYYKIDPEYVNPYLTSLNRDDSFPMGLASYGVSNSSNISTYSLKFNEIAGFFNFSEIKAFNASGYLDNVSDYGASLQMNAVVSLNGSVYWPQDVLIFITNESGVFLHDNVFNLSSDNATLTNQSITSPSGFVLGTGHNAYYGNYNSSIFLSYSLSFAGYMIMKVENSSSGTLIKFGVLILQNGTYTHEMFWFNNVTIHQRGDPYFLVNGTEYTPAGIYSYMGSYYDAELVLAGEANGESTSFTSLHGKLGLFYVVDNKLYSFPSYYTFGADTGESTNDVYVSYDGAVQVNSGQLDLTDFGQLNASQYPPLTFEVTSQSSPHATQSSTGSSSQPPSQSSVTSNEQSTMTHNVSGSQTSNTGSSDIDYSFLGGIVIVIAMLIASRMKKK
ncbi:thermopsin family protease [Sulfuracidifex tepidarius]|uniref:thermopsin family protease n=1 Tax=Sulfuracidifex tepidarius TaxID=1294262 RepID=UPI0013905FF7|nr:thermopsin family protease [Sulfuracidifex tepidarius]